MNLMHANPALDPQVISSEILDSKRDTCLKHDDGEELLETVKSKIQNLIQKIKAEAVIRDR